MQARPSLRSLELTGARAVIRRCLLISLPVFAAIGAVGYVLPAHDLHNGEGAHSNFADGGVVALLVLAAAGLCTYLLRDRRFGAGFAAGVLAMGGAVFALAPVLLAHMFQRVDDLVGEGVFAVGVIGLFCAGAATLFAEPIVYLLERRRIINAAKPAALPAARVVTA